MTAAKRAARMTRLAAEMTALCDLIQGDSWPPLVYELSQAKADEFSALYRQSVVERGGRPC